MILLTLCLLALDAILEWVFARYNAMWVRPAIMGGLICVLFIIVAKALQTDTGITITVPSQSNIAISFTLVAVYYGGRRLYKLYQFTTGKARNPLQSFFMDMIKGRSHPS